jgi:hypothetical protein
VSDRRRAVVGIAAGAAVLFIVWAMSSSVAGNDIGDIKGVVRDAIETNAGITLLPSGLAPGSIKDADRKALKATISAKYQQYFAGAAFTNRLTGLFAWVDRIAAKSSEGRLISYALATLDMDPPLVQGTSATVTGTYSLIEKQGYDLPDGRIATYGGTYTNDFTFTLERRSGRWYVVEFSDQPIDFVNDPAMASNLDVDPGAMSTKPPIGGEPLPLNP